MIRLTRFAAKFCSWPGGATQPLSILLFVSSTKLPSITSIVGEDEVEGLEDGKLDIVGATEGIDDGSEVGDVVG